MPIANNYLAQQEFLKRRLLEQQLAAQRAQMGHAYTEPEPPPPPPTPELAYGNPLEQLNALAAQMRVTPTAPDLETAQYRINAMLEGNPVSERAAGLGPATLQGEDYLSGSLDAVTPFPLMALKTGAATAKEAAQAARHEAWRKLENSRKKAGKRDKSGHYHGAPPGVDKPSDIGRITKEYADRIERGLAAGIEPGYFYQQGREAVQRVAEDPQRLAQLLGPTSTQVGPYQNLEGSIAALDQAAMGDKIRVGLYPNTLRPKVTNVLEGNDPWKGYKVDRYSNLLGAADESTHPLGRMPPNDQWEGRAMGFTKTDPKTGAVKGMPPSGPMQVAFTDEIRQRALKRVNKRRAEQGLRPLTLEEAQEIHWQVIRRETEGDPLGIGPKDTIQGSLPAFEYSHTWEAQPGPTSGLAHTMDPNDYMAEVERVVADMQGRDRFISGMGGELQEPGFVQGTGIYKDEMNPNRVSRSYVGFRESKSTPTGGPAEKAGVRPQSLARVDATEATRQYMLAQEARAGHHFQRSPKRVGDINAAEYQTGAPPSPQQTAALQAQLDETYGAERAGVIPTENGYRIVSFDKTLTGKPFRDQIPDTGDPPTFGKAETRYSEREPEFGGATKNLLEALDTKYPGPAKFADSPQVRQLAGDMSNLYQRLEAEGKLTGSQSLQLALTTWRDKGIAGLRELVKQGLAPAAVLGVVSQLDMGEEGPDYGV